MRLIALLDMCTYISLYAHVCLPTIDLLFVSVDKSMSIVNITTMDLDLQASQTDVVNLAEQLRDVQGQIGNIFRSALDAQNQRHLTQIRETMQIMQRSLETGSHAQAVIGLTSLINAQEEMRTDWNTQNMHAYEMLVSITDRVDACVHRLCDRLGLPVPPPVPALMHYEGGATPVRKRPRLTSDTTPDPSSPPPPFPGVIDALRNRVSCFEQFGMPQLNAAECRMLDTVVVESALCPDVAALRDVYHPQTCLYATEDDQKWFASAQSDAPDVHLGFYTATVLMEFCCHRQQMRRFTMPHLLARMGFGTVDLHGLTTELDETFYRRIFCEPRLSFLAEGHSPKLILFSGAGWARLWDAFLAEIAPSACDRAALCAWAQSPLVEELAVDLITELENTPVARLPVSTVLGALHRSRTPSEPPQGYESWPEMKMLREMEAMFLDGVSQIPHRIGGELMTKGDSYNGTVRAWPIALRQAAVRHIRNRIIRLYTIPRCGALLQYARSPAGPPPPIVTINGMADWLLMLSGDDGQQPSDANVWIGRSGPSLADRRAQLLRRLQQVMWSADDGGLPSDDVFEISETVLHRAVELRYGVATHEHWNQSRTHLNNLARLVQEATRHGPEYWTERERGARQHLPEEVLNGIRQELVCLSSDEYRAECMKRLMTIIHDPLSDGSAMAEYVLGESQMHPMSLFPQ